MSSFDWIISIFLSSSHFILFFHLICPITFISLTEFFSSRIWFSFIISISLVKDSFCSLILFPSSLNYLPMVFFFFVAQWFFFTPVLNSLPLRLKYYFSLCNTTFPWFFIVFYTCTSFTFEVADTCCSEVAVKNSYLLCSFQ